MSASTGVQDNRFFAKATFRLFVPIVLERFCKGTRFELNLTLESIERVFCLRKTSQTSSSCFLLLHAPSESTEQTRLRILRNWNSDFAVEYSP